MEGKRDDELGAGPGIDALMALRRRVFDTAEQERQEIVFARSDGNHTYDVTATPITDEEGRVRHVMTASLDITERSRTEEALRHSEELYRSLFDSMDMGFFLVEVCFDEDGRPKALFYRHANPAAARMVGEDYTCRHLSVINPNFEPYWYEIFGRVAETGEAVRMEQYASPLDAWYSFHLFRIGGAESRLVGNTFEDITEPRRATAAREESERELERRV